MNLPSFLRYWVRCDIFELIQANGHDFLVRTNVGDWHMSKASKHHNGSRSIEKGEAVLEIGFGTGHCLKRIAECVGETGKAYGIDISSGMLEVTKRRLDKAGQSWLTDRVELY